MGFGPLHDRVVVRHIKADEKTIGGTIVPVGPGARNAKGEIVALELKACARVLFGRLSGTEVRIDGQDLLIMKETALIRSQCLSFSIDRSRAPRLPPRVELSACYRDLGRQLPFLPSEPPRLRTDNRSFVLRY